MFGAISAGTWINKRVAAVHLAALENAMRREEKVEMNEMRTTMLLEEWWKKNNMFGDAIMLEILGMIDIHFECRRWKQEQWKWNGYNPCWSNKPVEVKSFEKLWLSVQLSTQVQWKLRESYEIVQHGSRPFTQPSCNVRIKTCDLVNNELSANSSHVKKAGSLGYAAART